VIGVSDGVTVSGAILSGRDAVRTPNRRRA
jgi:hypothetical protein